MASHTPSIRKSILLAAIPFLILSGCRPDDRPADLVITGGKVVTMDPGLPEAEAIAVKNGVIVAVGSVADMDPFISETTKKIDATDALVIPGLIEGHGHFMGLGNLKMNLDLMDARSWDEIVARVAAKAATAEPGAWIQGRGWHQEKWSTVPRKNIEGFPFHEALSKVSPNNPVLLRHASGHASMANAKAMDEAGITRLTKDPEGGEILHDSSGEPIGIFRERAQNLFQESLQRYLANRTPEEVDRDLRKTASLAMQEAVRKGITSFHDAGSSFKTVDFLKTLAEQGELDIRLWVMIRDSLHLLQKNFPDYRMVDYGDKFLTVRAIKWSIDGALGSRGAWLLEPYTDAPDLTGLNTAPPSSIAASGDLAMEHDLQLCVHAIGDRANRETLDLFEAAFKRDPDMKNRRWRVEHAQHLHPDDIPRFAELGAVPAMQGIHCTSDAPYVIARLGERRAREGAYVWQSLLSTGVKIINGTDAPVEDVDPLASFYASVTRRANDNSLFFPDQRMSREEALRSYTIDAAYGAFEEKSKGSLTPGKLADITILSSDIMTIPDEEITSTEVLYTIVGGNIKYSNDAGHDE
jgi:predicted amidohydrolase YtcJ